MAKSLRGVIIGASTLLGKELIEELNGSETSWDLRLADAGDAGGQLVPGGDEPLVVQPLTPDAFAGIDVAFFAGEAKTTRAHWREARAAGASVIDLTAALERESGVLVRSPWIAGGTPPTLETPAVIPAHPAAVMLGVVASRLKAAFGRARLAATVLEPASQQGARGLDEMHQQTVSLLGFHSLPQEVYDAQVAFNLRIGVGDAAKLDMSEIAATIRRQLGVITGEAVASSVAMQLVQAPVFHGYAMSVYAELPEGADVAAVRKALAGGVIELTAANEEAPSNQSVMQEQGIMVALREDSANSVADGRYWLWMAADNLKLAARHAGACAEELASLRPARKVQ